jgi:hypothetical protein
MLYCQKIPSVLINWFNPILDSITQVFVELYGVVSCILDETKKELSLYVGEET